MIGGPGSRRAAIFMPVRVRERVMLFQIISANDPTIVRYHVLIYLRMYSFVD